METKRVRSLNFSALEEDVLLECILKHKDSIENKHTDALTTNAKTNAWEQVTTEFNSRCPNSVARSTKALRDKYTNIKSALRKQSVAEEVKSSRMYGGSRTHSWRPKTEALAELASLIALSVTGTPAICDDDDDACTSRAVAAKCNGDNDDDNDDAPIRRASTTKCNDDDNDSSHNVPLRRASATKCNENNDDVPLRRISEHFLDEFKIENEGTPVRSPLQSESPTVQCASPNVYWATDTQAIIQKPQNTITKRRGALSNNKDLQDLKIKFLKREMEIREEEHAAFKVQQAQQKAEHEARMMLLAAQLQEIRDRVKCANTIAMT